jgi:hypothetical protein
MAQVSGQSSTTIDPAAVGGGEGQGVAANRVTDRRTGRVAVEQTLDL